MAKLKVLSGKNGNLIDIEKQPQSKTKLLPLVKSVKGPLKGSEISEEDYNKYIKSKYIHQMNS